MYSERKSDGPEKVFLKTGHIFERVLEREGATENMSS